LRRRPRPRRPGSAITSGFASCATGSNGRQRKLVPGAMVIGAEIERLPNTTALALPGVSAETQVIALDLAGVMVSAGAGVLARARSARAMCWRRWASCPRSPPRRSASAWAGQPPKRISRISRCLDGAVAAVVRRAGMSAPAKVASPATERRTGCRSISTTSRTTPIDPRVLEACCLFHEHFGNPHSESHVSRQERVRRDRGGARRPRAPRQRRPAARSSSPRVPPRPTTRIEGRGALRRAHPIAGPVPRPDHHPGDRAQMRAGKAPRRWRARALPSTTCRSGRADYWRSTASPRRSASAPSSYR